MPPFVPTLLLACAPSPIDPPVELYSSPSDAPRGADPLERTSPIPAGFVDLRALDGLRFSVGFHRSDNITGAPLPGYGAPGAWLLEPTAMALRDVQRDLESEGLGLLVHDAYRPLRASAALLAWTSRTKQAHLIEESYLDKHSDQNHGTAVEVSLVDITTGAPLDMGTTWNTFSGRSHFKRARWPISDNREALREAMRGHGFHGNEQTWWHFAMEVENSRPRDVPYGCFEPKEGNFEAPNGWGGPGWRAPTDWDPSPCPSGQTK